eukprot:8292777-Pyramimonas_sp.AAC.1
MPAASAGHIVATKETGAHPGTTIREGIGRTRTGTTQDAGTMGAPRGIRHHPATTIPTINLHGRDGTRRKYGGMEICYMLLGLRAWSARLCECPSRASLVSHNFAHSPLDSSRRPKAL